MAGKHCPICGEPVPYNVRLEALPPDLLGSKFPGYSAPLHRCDPKRLAAIDGAGGSDANPYQRQRTEAERLAEGFRLLEGGG